MNLCKILTFISVEFDLIYHYHMNKNYYKWNYLKLYVIYSTNVIKCKSPIKLK